VPVVKYRSTLGLVWSVSPSGTVVMKGLPRSSSFSCCGTSTAGGVVMFRLCSVTMLALAWWLDWPSTFKLKGYAIPPFVGRVLEPSVAGIKVTGDCGLSETTTVGVGRPELPIPVIGVASGVSPRSSARTVASARPEDGGAALENSRESFERSSAEFPV
jgi:hypothetical protein